MLANGIKYFYFNSLDLKYIDRRIEKYNERFKWLACSGLIVVPSLSSYQESSDDGRFARRVSKEEPVQGYLKVCRQGSYMLFISGSAVSSCMFHVATRRRLRTARQWPSRLLLSCEAVNISPLEQRG
jgi:hypothetical protein